jgi:uncharacterized protein (TIRG00374 family)
VEAGSVSPRRSPRAVLLWIAIAVTLAFTYLAVRNAHLGDVWDALRESQKVWLLPASGVLAAAIAARGIRWWSLFDPVSRPPLREVLRALMVGYFFNNVLPLRAGEALRVVTLARRTGVSIAETTATAVVERAYDVLALLVLLVVMSPWLPEVSWLQAAAFALVGVGAVVLAMAFLLARWGTRVLRIVLYPLSWIPYLTAERFERGLRNLVQGFAGLHSIRIAVVGFFWTMLSWLLVSLSFWLVLLGFDFGLSPVAAVLVVIAINLSLVLPSSPGAVGVFEWATIVALDAYGVPDSDALSYALVVHALNLVPFIVAGVLILHRDALPRRRASVERAQS